MTTSHPESAEDETSTDRQTRTTRPALDVLDKDQDRLLFEGDPDRAPPIKPLVGGFDTHKELIEWYQAAAVRTLGHLDKVLPPALIVGDSTLVNSLVASNGSDAHRYVRQRLLERINDACDIAYKDLRSRAEERTGAEQQGDGRSWEGIDPEKERNPAQRPAFRVLDQSQATVLADLFDGFDSRTELSRWVRKLKGACNGEHPAELMDRIVSQRTLFAALLCRLGDDETEAAIRRRFAVAALLPSFLRAARTLRGSERVQSRKDPNPWNEVRGDEWGETHE